MTSKEKASWVKGVILSGTYKGKTVEVQFGKPLKILVDDKDITNCLVSLRISIDVDGHLIYLKLAELDYSQVPPEVGKNGRVV